MELHVLVIYVACAFTTKHPPPAAQLRLHYGTCCTTGESIFSWRCFENVAPDLVNFQPI